MREEPVQSKNSKEGRVFHLSSVLYRGRRDNKGDDMEYSSSKETATKIKRHRR